MLTLLVVPCRVGLMPGAEEEQAAVTTDTGSHEASQDEVRALRERIADLERELALCRQLTTDTWHHQLTAIESALDGVAFLDQQGAYTYMNQAHAEVHGYDRPDELLGQSWT